MPLYRVLDRGLRLPRIGTIRKGSQVPVIDKTSGQPKHNAAGEIVMRPKEERHFIFHIDPTQQEEVLAVLGKAYGTREIMELNVFLANPDAFSNWSSWMEAYNYNQLVARSDERNVLYLFDVYTNETLVRDVVIAHSKNPESPAGKLVKGIEIGKPLPYNPEMVVAISKTSQKAITFKAVGRLNVVIKELRRLVTFTVITGGYWYDIPAINTTVDILDSIAQATGRGANTIPLRLRRVERERTYTAEDGSKKKKICYDIELEIRADITAGLLETYEESPFAIKLQSPRQPTLPELSASEPDEDYGGPVAEDPIQGHVIEETTGVNVSIPTNGEVDELIDPLENRAINFAARSWNITFDQAKKNIAANNNFYAPMSKKLFKDLVAGNKPK